MSSFESRCRARIGGVGDQRGPLPRGPAWARPRRRWVYGAGCPAPPAHAGRPTGRRGPPAFPAEPPKSWVRASQNQAHLRKPPELVGNAGSQAPRLASRHGCEAGPPLRDCLKTSQVILTQALYGNPPRIPGAMGRLQGLGPELRDAGRSAWEPGQGWALPTPQQQRVRRGHPGREAKSPRFRTRLRTPASTSRQVRARPRPGPTARGISSGEATPNPVLTGAEAMGGAVGTRFLRVGETGGRRGQGGRGDRAVPGTVCPERRRLPVTTTTAAQSNPALQAWPAEPRGFAGAETARPPPAGGRDASGSGETTHQSQGVVTLLLPPA